MDSQPPLCWMVPGALDTQPEREAELPWIARTRDASVTPLVLPVRGGSAQKTGLAASPRQSDASGQEARDKSRSPSRAALGAGGGRSEGSARAASAEADTAAPAACPRCTAAEDERAALVKAYQTATQDMLETLEADRHAREGELIALSLEIARSLVGGLAQTGSSAHLALVRAALQVLDDDAPDRVRVSPAAFSALSPELEAGGALEAYAAQIVVDPELSDLGCVVSNEETRVDGTVEARLERIREALEAARALFGSERKP